jgi:hypothetical protein
MSVEETLKQISKEVHKPINKKFERRKVVSNANMDILSVDLADMQEWADINDGYRFILTAIDIHSRFAWAIPLKSKEAKEVLAGIETIFEDAGQKSKFIWSDQGGEFINKIANAYYKKYGIKQYSTFSEHKAAVIERFNRTLKTNMWKYFTSKNTRRWIDELPWLIETYNTTVHSTIGKTPEDAFDIPDQKNIKVVEPVEKEQKVRFAVGDRVRISRTKGLFEKGFHNNWSREIYIITKVLKTQPVTYHIKDSLGEDIVGSFYNNELQKTKQAADFGLVESVLKRKGRADNQMLFVKWVGLSEKYNSWIYANEDVLETFNN